MGDVPLKVTDADRVKAFELRWGVCPICEAKLGGHHYFQMAMQKLDLQNRDAQSDLERLASEHKWQEMSRISGGSVRTDDLEVYSVIKCHNGKLAVIAERSYLDIWADDKRIGSTLVADETTAELEQAGEGKWEVIPG